MRFESDGVLPLCAADLEGGRHFFNAVKEGDSVLLSCDDENECHLWVMALYRATGQSHKPAPPITPANKNSTISKIQGDADRARKHGMEEYISADPCKFDHSTLFKMLQTLTLDYRLNDPYCSLVREESAGVHGKGEITCALRTVNPREHNIISFSCHFHFGVTVLVKIAAKTCAHFEGHFDFIDYTV